jgi:hypothetical protein
MEADPDIGGDQGAEEKKEEHAESDGMEQEPDEQRDADHRHDDADEGDHEPEGHAGLPPVPLQAGDRVAHGNRRRGLGRCRSGRGARGGLALRAFDETVHIAVLRVETGESPQWWQGVQRPARVERALAGAVPLGDELAPAPPASVTELILDAHRRAAVRAGFRQGSAALRAEAIAAFVVVPALRADPAEDEQLPPARQHPGARLAVGADVFVRVRAVPHQFTAAAARAGERMRLQCGRARESFHSASIPDAGNVIVILASLIAYCRDCRYDGFREMAARQIVVPSANRLHFSSSFSPVAKQCA